MPIPVPPLQRGDRGEAVAQLHRTLEAIGRPVDPKERKTRVFGGGTEAVLRKLQGDSAIPVTGVFDTDTSAVVTRILSDIGPFTVYGTVTDADATPIVGATVIAMDVDLRSTEELGQTTTDSGGEYEVRYAASRFARAEKASADVVVRVVLDDKTASSRRSPSTRRPSCASTSRRRNGAARPNSSSSTPPARRCSPEPRRRSSPSPTSTSSSARPGSPPRRGAPTCGAQHLVVAAADDAIPPAAFHGWLRTGQPETWEALRAVAHRRAARCSRRGARPQPRSARSARRVSMPSSPASPTTTGPG